MGHLYPRERNDAGEQLEEDDTEGPDVSPRIDVRRREELLGRHVHRRSESLARLHMRGIRASSFFVLAFEMPGAGIPNFLRKAALIAKARIYDLRSHRDEVLLPVIKHWRIFELQGLDAAAEEARRRLAEHLETLDVAAARFEARLVAKESRALAQG